MAYLAFGILLFLLGSAALAVSLPLLGWTLVAIGGILCVAHIAVGPPRLRRGGTLRRLP